MRLNKILVVGCLMLGFPAASLSAPFNSNDLFNVDSNPPDAAGAFARTADRITGTNKVVEARKYLGVANSKILLEPNNDRYYLGRAQIYRDLHDYQSSLADINHAISLKPTTQPYYAFRAAVQANLNNYSASLQDTDKAISIGPESADLDLQRADALHMLGRYQESLVASNRSVVLNPKSSKTYIIRGVTKFRLKDYKGAQSDCERAESMEPGNLALTKQLRQLLSTVSL